MELSKFREKITAQHIDKANAKIEADVKLFIDAGNMYIELLVGEADKCEIANLLCARFGCRIAAAVMDYSVDYVKRLSSNSHDNIRYTRPV